MRWAQLAIDVYLFAIVATIIAFVGLVIVQVTRESDEFKRVCTDNGGTVVYDGRQKQCLPRPSGAS